MPVALITGVNGQDGSYLAEFLLQKGYHVVGTTLNRNINQERILHLREKIEIVETDLLAQTLLEDILRKCKPDEVYNLAARASSSEFWTQPVLTAELNALAVTRLLDAIRTVDRNVRFVQASSSEVFGNAAEVPQTEATPFHPRNPYGVAKAFGHWTTVIYRERYGLFACSSILYNHESPRRGLEFITRKVSHAVAKIKLGQARELRLGNLESKRDWGFACDYVQAMWLMLQQPAPDDYVVATGEAHSVRELCEVAFSHVGLNYQDYVVQDRENFRPADTALLVGNPAKAERLLGWKRTVTFLDLVRMMVEADLSSIQNIPEPLT
ncbi:MAG: GDP-mannose 4,6-dehydratase [Terriglobales bacterium]|jgi:GDPmannose 4,6-dehydratase